VFGIIEYGFVFKDSLTVTSATRSGVRTAAALAKDPNYATQAASAVASAVGAVASDSPQILWIYKAGPNGRPCVDQACATENANFSINCTVCYRYSWNAISKTWTDTGGTSWTALNQNACSSSSSTPDSVGVYLKANHKFFTSLFGSTKTLTDSTVMRLEPRPAASCGVGT
jgi:hypothetical protein